MIKQYYKRLSTANGVTIPSAFNYLIFVGVGSVFSLNYFKALGTLGLIVNAVLLLALASIFLSLTVGVWRSAMFMFKLSPNEHPGSGRLIAFLAYGWLGIMNIAACLLIFVAVKIYIFHH